MTGTTSRTEEGFWFSGYLIAAHDFDGDAFVDVALMNYYGNLSVMRGLGDGSWAEAKLVRDGADRNDLPDGVDGWESTFADIDENGATDILAGRSVLVDPLGDPSFVGVPSERRDPQDHDLLRRGRYLGRRDRRSSARDSGR